MVDELLPRESELIRPQVANVKLAVLLFSVREPDMNLNLLDKFLVHIEHSGLNTLIVLTKQDLADDDGKATQMVKELYERIGYEVMVTSSLTGSGSDELRNRLAGVISVFSGQSGVGKSTLLNRLVPGLELETGEISLRLGRGRHTTRHVELMDIGNGGFVADTPGSASWTFWNSAWRSFRSASGSLLLMRRIASSAAAVICMSQPAVSLRHGRLEKLQTAAMSITSCSTMK